jgi:hypothetical protein
MLGLAVPAFGADTGWPTFTDITEAAGIKFKHSLGDFDLSNIAEATGPGCAIFDYDNDGFMDIYFVNGRWHPDISDNRGRALRGKLWNALYRNNGDGTFTDVTERAGVGWPRIQLRHGGFSRRLRPRRRPRSVCLQLRIEYPVP